MKSNMMFFSLRTQRKERKEKAPRKSLDPRSPAVSREFQKRARLLPVSNNWNSLSSPQPFARGFSGVLSHSQYYSRHNDTYTTNRPYTILCEVSAHKRNYGRVIQRLAGHYALAHIHILPLRNRRANKTFPEKEVHSVMGAGVFEIPGKWCSENGVRFLRGALSLVRFFGHAKKWTESLLRSAYWIILNQVQDQERLYIVTTYIIILFWRNINFHAF